MEKQRLKKNSVFKLMFIGKFPKNIYHSISTRFVGEVLHFEFILLLIGSVELPQGHITLRNSSTLGSWAQDHRQFTR